MESMDHARHQDLSRRLLEELERLAAADDIPALGGKRPEAIGPAMARTIPPLAPPGSQLENAVHEPRRRPRDSHAMSETRTPLRQIKRRGTLLGHAGRLVAAIGVSAIIAQFFVIMMPAARQPDNTQVFAAAVQSITARSQQHRSADVQRPALASFQSLLASDDTSQAAGRVQPEKRSDRVLQRFMQWSQKANPGEAAR
jgi:hypothetical protein